MNFVTIRSPNLGSGRTWRFSARRRRDIFFYSLLRTLGAVERTTLLTILDTLGVEDAAQDVITDAGQVLDAAAADEHHRVLLQVVAFARDVANGFDAGGQTDLATLRRAEFGFFGVVVYTRVQTPRRWGQPFRAGTLFRTGFGERGLRMSWLTVGIKSLL